MEGAATAPTALEWPLSATTAAAAGAAMTCALRMRSWTLAAASACVSGLMKPSPSTRFTQYTRLVRGSLARSYSSHWKDE